LHIKSQENKLVSPGDGAAPRQNQPDEDPGQVCNEKTPEEAF
jgi:hypothetical protein